MRDRLPKAESILGTDWDVPKSITMPKTRLNVKTRILPT